MARMLGLLVKTRRWCPEDDKELLSLRSEGLEEAEIASRLGRTTKDVEKRVAIRSKDAFTAGFRLTLPMKYRKRVMELDGEPSLILRMTHEDEADIVRLFAEEKSRAQIAELKYPTYSGMHVARMWRQLKRDKHSDQRPPISDMQGIKILRLERKKWPEVRDLKYPEWPVDTARKAYNRWSNLYDNVKDIMSAAEKEDIRRLLAEGKTWSQIKDLRYPKWSEGRVRDSFGRQPAQRSKVCLKLTMCANDLKHINRMLGEGKKFSRIMDIKFPEWSDQNVRMVYMAIYRAQKRDELQNEESNVDSA